MGDYLKQTFAASVTFMLSCGPAIAFCPFMNEGPWSNADLPIPVFLNENIATSVCNGAACPALDGARRTVETVLDEFHDNSGSNLNFSFAGTTDRSPGSNISNAIHIYGGSCANSPALAVTSWAADSSGSISRANVRICQDNNGGPIAWTSFAETGDGTISFHGVLTHELMHGVGFDHPDQWCGQNSKSVVKQFYSSDLHHLYPDDIDGLQSLYGRRTNEIGHVARSFDGLDWSANGPHLPIEAEQIISRFGACNSTTAEGFGRLVGVEDERNVLQFFGGNRFNWSWLSDGLGVLGISEYYADIACKSRSESMAFWLCGTSLTTGGSSICRAESSDAGSTWSNLKIIASGSDRTGNIGVNSAFDPATGDYVAVWRNTRDEIVSKVVHPDADTQRYSTGSGVARFLRASDAVSIACAPKADAGSQNCLLAWSDTGWSRTLRWAHASITASATGPQLDIGQVKGMGYVIHGMPAVAFSGDPSLPWHLAFHQGQNTVFTLRKPVDIDAAWQNEQQYSVGQKVVSPALGVAVIAGDDVGGTSVNGLLHSITNATP